MWKSGFAMRRGDRHQVREGVRRERWYGADS